MIAIAVAVTALATGIAVGAATRRVPVTDDEAWFLHVVERCRRGDVLYRDVFYGAGPLPVWLALLAVRLVRPQMLVMRALSVAYFVALLAAGAWVLDASGAPGWTIAAFWLVAVAFSGPSWGVDNHYGQLTFLLTTIAAGAVAEWTTGGPVWWLVIAGAASGSALAAKHSVAGVAGAAFGLVVVAGAAHAGDVALFAAGAVGAFGLCLVPVARRGGFGDYVLRAFVNKATYLATGRLWPRQALAEVARSGRTGSHGIERLGLAVAVSPFVLLLVLPAAIASDGVLALSAALPAAARGPALVGLALSVAALAGLCPRADPPHLRGTVPTALLGVALSLQALDVARSWWPPPPAVTWAAAVPLAAWTLTALVASLDTVHRIPLPEGWFDRAVPFFRGLPVLRREAGISPADGHGLREFTGGVVFLLRPDAAFWYLASGLTDPTPYDYPYASVFGPTGQAETIDAIKRGDIRWVCSPGPMEGPLAPVDVQRFVFETMHPAAATLAGMVYQL